LRLEQPILSLNLDWAGLFLIPNQPKFLVQATVPLDGEVWGLSLD